MSHPEQKLLFSTFCGFTFLNVDQTSEKMSYAAFMSYQSYCI